MNGSLEVASGAAEAPRLLSIGAVRNKTSLSETSLRRLWEAGEFPKPIRLGRNRLAWIEPRVDAWINAQVARAEAA